ncbi:MAG: FG-GAP-like repeat-containing protein, partial [Anaerolineae bacterium]|nr:FG-GAP-like repeat-containing protein [Anaerolineae bacterium]
TPDWIGEGEGRGDFFGSAVGAAGDVNGDGYADLIVGAYHYVNWGDQGKAYVYLGSPLGLSGVPVWSVSGENLGDRFGQVVGTAGDVNGDGFSDVVVGAPNNGGTRGKIYVYLGTTTGLDASPAWTATGESNLYLGNAVATAGDVNGDGFADLVVGVYAYNYNRGQVDVYHGSASGLGDSPAWTDVGENTYDRLGAAVGTAGDVNGDGFADLVVGAYGYNSYSGKVYVYHGSALGLGVPNAEFTGVDADPRFGNAVGTAGDVNGDGYSDVIVGTYGYPSSSYTGTVHVYEGSAIGVSPIAAWTVTGEGADGRFGWSIGTAGDVNGDGFSDIVVGAEGHGDNTGKVYAYLGGAGSGRTALSRQGRGDGSSLPVQPWGVSYAADAFEVSLKAVPPLGRGGIKLQVQACPSGVPFGAEACVDRLTESWREADDADGTLLVETISGLEEYTVYRWRARAVYDSPLYSHGPWRRFIGQAMGTEIRVLELPTDVAIFKTVAPTDPAVGELITYTLTFAALGGPAADVVITDILPDDIAEVRIMTSGAPISDTGTSPGFVWEVGDLAPGEGGVITITGIAESTRFINTASITTTSPDLNPANNAATVQTHMSGVIFVDQDAPGPAHDGHSWATALTEFREALVVAGAGDEIWVAEGTYTPTDDGNRGASFALAEGVKIYGGFSATEVWPHERDWASNLTVLSGDIGTLHNDEDNVYHVVTATNVTSATLLDGFTIIGGNADGSAENGTGGGLLIKNSNLVLRNVVFSGNYAEDHGGGMVNVGHGYPTLIHVVFSGNAAGGDGGGLYVTMPGMVSLT